MPPEPAAAPVTPAQNPSLANQQIQVTDSTPTIDYSKPFAPDTTKTAEENAAAQKAYDEGKPAWEKEQAEAKAKADADKANDTKATPFKVDEIKLPEGLEIDKTAQEGFVELVNKHGIPRSAVADLVNLQANTMKAFSERGNKLWDEMQTTWQTEVKNDPDVGGAKQEESLSRVSKLVDQYGSKELRGVFDLTGAGNNLHVIKFLDKIARELGESAGNVSGRPADVPMTLAQRLYPNQGKQ